MPPDSGWDLVRLCADYLTLRAETHPAEVRRKRLTGLNMLFSDPHNVNVDPPSSRRKHARTEVDLSVEVVVDNRRIPAHVLDIGGGGLRVEFPDSNIPMVGWATVIACDPPHTTAYEFRCDFRWRRGSQAGLRFLGAPTKRAITN